MLRVGFSIYYARQISSTTFADGFRRILPTHARALSDQCVFYLAANQRKMSIADEDRTSNLHFQELPWYFLIDQEGIISTYFCGLLSLFANY